MRILTFDTSLNNTYLTYGENDNIILSKIIHSDNEKYHSAYLIPEIISILQLQNITMQDIDVIGINEGPGSFTGIRICTVIARVAAQQTGIKVVSVPSLEILSKINSTDKKTLVLLDARKNKIYSAIYGTDGNVIQPPNSVSNEQVKEIVDNQTYEIITDSSIYKLLKEQNINSINYEKKEYPLGQFLYEITLKKILTNPKEDYHWAKVKPLYIQPPSITLPKKVGI